MKRSGIMNAAMDTPRVDTHGHLYGPIRDLTRGTLGPVLIEGCAALYGLPEERPPQPKTLESIYKAGNELRAGGREAVFRRAFETAYSKQYREHYSEEYRRVYKLEFSRAFGGEFSKSWRRPDEE